MRRNTIPRQLARLLQLVILLLVYFLVKAASKAPSIVETLYSQKLYPIIRGAVSSVTGMVPFSIAELIALLVLAIIVVLLVVRVIRLILVKKGSLVKLISLVISVALAAAYLVFAFYVMWGFNYFRQPIAQKLDLPEREYTKEELSAVCFDLAEHASMLRELVPTDDNGVFTGEFDQMRENIRAAYADFGASRPSFKANVPLVKPLASSDMFTRGGTEGMFIFLTEEPCINSSIPFLALPFASAHETAHFMGYAREEDASFLAFLVLRDAADPSAAYSGYMHALVNCAKALAKADREEYERLVSTYSEGMKKDLAAYSEFYRPYADTKAWEASNKLNDSYLKANQQEKGVLSYEEDVALILRFYDSRRFFN
ncbi:MAG: DUF3810 domain-containing protein [Clostridiales bacterium]|nr:DUF3810 domain-containing protein [Clostridiales bacterium]